MLQGDAQKPQTWSQFVHVAGCRRGAKLHKNMFISSYSELTPGGQPASPTEHKRLRRTTLLLDGMKAHSRRVRRLRQCKASRRRGTPSATPARCPPASDDPSVCKSQNSPKSSGGEGGMWSRQKLRHPRRFDGCPYTHMNVCDNRLPRQNTKGYDG